MKSKSQKVREYFTKHPLATPKLVGDKFDVPMPLVYKLRKEAHATFVAAQNTQAEVPQPPIILEYGFVNAKEEFKPSQRADDVQYGGDHYKEMGVQPWAAMESWMSREAFMGFLRGNAIKYLARTEKKGGIEDLKKARHYLDKLVEIAESGE
jgi:hypothetical protein